MVIKTEEFKEVCKTILGAVDNSELSTLTETLELKTKGRDLFLNITNGEYYLSVRFPLDHEEEFRASVNANLFLKLIASITTETISLSVKETHVVVKANGTYKIPLIFDGENLLELNEITIDNPTVEEKISGEILQNIYNYNGRSREVVKYSNPSDIQNLFYIDDAGCVTFSSATACKTYFTLEKPIKILVNFKTVKLFKLFKDEMTDFVLGYDPLNEEVVQTKISLSTPSIKLVVITDCNNANLNLIPSLLKQLNARIEYDYPYSLLVNKDEFLQTINRLLLFNTRDSIPAIKVCFVGNELILVDREDNEERISFNNEFEGNHEDYEMFLNMNYLKSTLDTISEGYLTLAFGNHQSVVVKRSGVVNLIAECREN